MIQDAIDLDARVEVMIQRRLGPPHATPFRQLADAKAVELVGLDCITIEIEGVCTGLEALERKGGAVPAADIALIQDKGLETVLPEVQYRDGSFRPPDGQR